MCHSNCYHKAQTSGKAGSSSHTCTRTKQISSACATSHIPLTASKHFSHGSKGTWLRHRKCCCRCCIHVPPVVTEHVAGTLPIALSAIATHLFTSCEPSRREMVTINMHRLFNHGSRQEKAHLERMSLEGNGFCKLLGPCIGPLVENLEYKNNYVGPRLRCDVLPPPASGGCRPAAPFACDQEVSIWLKQQMPKAIP